MNKRLRKIGIIILVIVICLSLVGQAAGSWDICSVSQCCCMETPTSMPMSMPMNDFGSASPESSCCCGPGIDDPCRLDEIPLPSVSKAMAAVINADTEYPVAELTVSIIGTDIFQDNGFNTFREFLRPAVAPPIYLSNLTFIC